MSDKLKHTPGPWQVRTIDGSIGHIETLDGVAVANAEIVGTLRQPNTAERKANAALISAAPELLEALEAMVKRIEYYSAIPESERPTIEQWEYTEGSTEMDKARAAIAKAKP
jgi:hypothetical protein